jgi:predicted oxidoreductase
MGFEMSRLVQGFWRLDEWNMTREELLDFVKFCLDNGIDTFDHADIYGLYTSEKIFGDAISLEKGIRDKMKLVTKCGIIYFSDKFPDLKAKHYNTSKEHITRSVEDSLRNFNTDYIDLLLIHRPDPFMDANETAEAFVELKKSGKVRNFGVSNFLPMQFDLLQSRLDFELVTNQVEISAMELKNFDNGTLDHCQMKKVLPMAWSPLAGGRVFTEKSEKADRVRKTLENISKELGGVSMDKLLYSFLLKHPSKIVPVMGSGKKERIISALGSLDIALSREQWFRIWESSKGKEVD